jgi:hypothetical protein
MEEEILGRSRIYFIADEWRERALYLELEVWNI